ncbi:MAG: orotate phosphoribosyltransferase [Magnetococcales bacterium]|nr:orotate phosphoribosyltransferase [Magnetococcales bacterium]
MTAAQSFLQFAIAHKVLRFGSFTTKAGRQTPYFFNAGLFNSGKAVSQLARFYAQTLLASSVGYDMLFGPAYKGIPLATATAMALADHHGLDLPFAFNRKEAKDHGEGGVVIGAPLQGRVLVIDDVISAGTSVGESVRMIRQAGATLAGVLIALDRQERGNSQKSAVQETAALYNAPVVAIACLDDLIEVLRQDPQLASHLPAILAYKDQWGA